MHFIVFNYKSNKILKCVIALHMLYFKFIHLGITSYCTDHNTMGRFVGLFYIGQPIIYLVPDWKKLNGVMIHGLVTEPPDWFPKTSCLASESYRMGYKPYAHLVDYNRFKREKTALRMLRQL